MFCGMKELTVDTSDSMIKVYVGMWLGMLIVGMLIVGMLIDMPFLLIGLC